jgi:serine/threonine protein kinase
MSQTPTAIGKYQIIREIARSNDIVYEAYDPLMDRRVALKELAIPNGSTPPQVKDRIERFEREARAAGRLAHPNIMTVYDVGSDVDRHYMAMEYLDGHTLRNELDTKGLVEHSQAIEVIEAVLEGLDHAHNNGVVHRDIKPDNIQLTSSGIKITDFGIARLTFQPNLTIDGKVFATPSYMSPEQIRGGEIDARSDVFSAGVVLYEMLSGQKPFQGDSVIAITHAILNNEPSQPSAVNYPLWQVIQRALDKSPGLRYASAHDMVEAVRQAEKLGDGLVFDMTGNPSPNPYANAYANPYAPPVVVPPQTVNVPPAQYGYNPYIPGPHQTGPVPGHSPPPTIYYPPPPRRPMFKPETEATLRRVGWIIVVMGTFFGMIIAALMYFTNSFPQVGNAAPRTDIKTASTTTSPMGNGEVPQVNTPAGASADYVEPPGIEEGLSYEQYAGIAARFRIMSQGGELNDAERQSYLERAAEAYVKQAEAAVREGRPDSDRRSALYSAQDVAPAGTPVAKEIEIEIRKIG